jgi:pimeloyl-ACP methyl ester carboxylesterase
MKEHFPRGLSLDKLHPKKAPIVENLERTLEEEQAVHFDEQWSHPVEIDVAGEKLSTYDIRPENPKSDTPVFIMDGWGSTPAMWKNNVHALVETGRRTIGVNAPHGVEPQVTPADGMADIPDAELRRITAFMATLDAHSVQKTDVIAHSEGGIDALLAARMYPVRFRNIVLVDPGGMIGPDSVMNLSARFAYDAVAAQVQAFRGGTSSKLATISNSVISSTVKAPVKATNEMLSVARTQVIGLLRELKELGIGIVIISGVDDMVFPMDRMTKNIHEQKQSEDEDIEKLLDGFYSVKGHHNEFLLQSAQYTRLAETAVTALEEKQKRLAVQEPKTDIN